MAPPGVYTFYDQLDMMAMPATSPPFLSFSKSSFSPSFPSPPLSSGLPVFHNDHDYALVPTPDSESQKVSSEDIQQLCSIDTAGQEDHSSNDAMLSSCAMELTTPLEGLNDTDFLHELDDLDFTLDDFDPCCDVAMEDSFQEFIDSALEQTSSSFLNDYAMGEETSASEQETIILNKENFLRMLNLRPVAESQHPSSSSASSATSLLSPVPPSPSSTSPLLSSELSSVITTNPDCRDSIPRQAVTDSTCGAPSMLACTDSSPMGVVPTKRCSCSGSDTESRAVYSTARTALCDDVKTCASTLSTQHSREDITCENCGHNKMPSDKLLTPLYVDTSFGSSDPFPSFPEDSFTDLFNSRLSKNEADFITWLTDSLQQQVSDSNRPTTTTNNDNSSSLSSHCENFLISEKMEEKNNSCQDLDLESFVDLDDLVMSDTSSSTASCGQQTEMTSDDPGDARPVNSPLQDHTYDKHVHPCVAQDKNDNFPGQNLLKLSFLAESRDATNYFFNDHLVHPRTKMNLSPTPSLSSPSSSLCPSPATSPFPRSPSSSTEMLHPDDLMEGSDMKVGHLALLNLFADENVSTLLHSDPAVPDIRFM